MRNIDLFKRHLREQRAVKVIAGIDNFDIKNVEEVAQAAQVGLASAIDVSCQEDIIKTAKNNAKLPIFVSSIQPFKLAKAVQWGADAIEIGNFDALYKTGISFSADDVYEIALETMSLTQKTGIFTCVTIPGNISIKEQIELARKLELLGIDLLQTEGRGTGKTLAETSIYNTLELSNEVGIPIMTASGIDKGYAPSAFAAGASAVGVGSAVNKLGTKIEMISAVRELVGSVSYRDTIRQDIYSTKSDLLIRG